MLTRLGIMVKKVTVLVSSAVLMVALAACDDSFTPAGNTLQQSELSKRPNILIIVADDLGYSDLGSYGGEIDTPNLDRLASDGIRLTNFLVAPTCSPTRSMLMSGTYNHRAGLGAMAEWVADNQRDKPGYEGYLNQNVAALPDLLRDAGYHTFMAGKWHLGMQPGQGPAVRGFEQSFAMLPGAGDHFSDRGLNPHLPKVPYRENGQPAQLPEDFYSTTFYTDKAIAYIDQVRESEKPFFGYVAYTAPHWPLQVPERYSSKYAGKYDSGYESISSRRLERMKALGIVAPDRVPNPGSSCFADWSMLTPDEKARQTRAMEIYAGMVDALDENIGRLIDHLKETNELDNTLIVFISDNGADARPMDGLSFEAEFVAKNYDNSLDNVGAENSFVSYGGAWAEVGSTPFRLHKGVITEGGIRVPAIIHFPSGDLKPGIHHGFASVLDLVPTFLEVAGTEHPGDQYRGRAVWPAEGKTMLPYLRGEADAVHETPLYGFSVHRAQGLQWGKWKIVRLPEPHGDGNWELYNLDADPGETRNLASSEPDRLAEMTARWEGFATSTGVVIAQEGSRQPEECLLE